MMSNKWRRKICMRWKGMKQDEVERKREGRTEKKKKNRNRKRERYERRTLKRMKQIKEQKT